MNIWFYTALFVLAPLFVLIVLTDEIDDDDDMGPGMMIPVPIPTN